MSQQNLFGEEGIPEDWKEEWQDMPEFIQKDIQPFRSLKVHFEKEEDVKKFAELVGQKITSDTKSLWYPELTHTSFMDKRYYQMNKEEEKPKEENEIDW